MKSLTFISLFHKPSLKPFHASNIFILLKLFYFAVLLYNSIFILLIHFRDLLLIYFFTLDQYILATQLCYYCYFIFTTLYYLVILCFSFCYISVLFIFILIWSFVLNFQEANRYITFPCINTAVKFILRQKL